MSDLIRQVNKLQAIVDEDVQPEVGRWITWTPTVTQDVSVTVTVTLARYIVSEDIARILVELAVTGSGTTANPIVIGGLPTIMQPANPSSNGVIGDFAILDNGTAWYTGVVVPFGANDLRFRRDGASSNFVGQAPAFALANTDVISFKGTWER